MISPQNLQVISSLIVRSVNACLIPITANPIAKIARIEISAITSMKNAVSFKLKCQTNNITIIAIDIITVTVNKNLIPFDQESPMVTSGIRIGTPALTTRGMKESDMKQVARYIDQAVTHRDDKQALEKVRQGVIELTRQFPIYQGLQM